MVPAREQQEQRGPHGHRDYVMFPAMGPSATDLRTIPLFHNFVEAELASIGALFSPAKVEQGKALFEVGEPATTFYVLTAGEVVLDRPGDDVFKLYPPALIGELGALTNLPRSTRAVVSPGSTARRRRCSTCRAPTSRSRRPTRRRSARGYRGYSTSRAPRSRSRAGCTARRRIA